MTADDALRLRKEYLMPCLGYFYSEPPLFVRGEMQYLYDEAGKKYLDFFAGVSVMNCGHSNPFIIDRITKQLGKLQHLTNVYLTEPVVLLAEKLAGVLPGGLHNSFFCMSGSEANEGALLLARIATGKKKFIALNGSLHGRTSLTMAATGIPMWRADPFLSDDFYFARNVDEIAAVLAQNDDIAAFICEPIQGNAGILPMPDGFFARLLPILKAHGVLFIADEVQSGFARTGKMFAVQHYEAVPDIMTISKAFGNGIPIAAFSTTREIAAKFTSPSASTLGGNPVSAAAALAVLDYIEQEGLCERAGRLGAILQSRLLEIQKKCPLISEVRGKGLMLGAELSRNGEPLPKITDQVLEALKNRGIILGKNGIHRNVLAFQPPLVISEVDVGFLADNLADVLQVCSIGE